MFSKKNCTITANAIKRHALDDLFIGLLGLRAHPRAPGFKALLPAWDELRQFNALRRVRGQMLEDQDVV